MKKLKLLIITLLILSPFKVAISQVSQIEKELKNINKIDQINSFRIKNPEWLIKVAKVDDHDIGISQKLLNLNEGEISTISDESGTITYKVLEKNIKKKFRTSYILLRGDNYSSKEIEILRNEIIHKFNSGVSFSDLMQQYELEGTDLGWQSYNTVFPEFAQAASKRKEGEIFKVDVKEKKFYYVVLKTHEDKEDIELTLISVRRKASN